MRLFFFTFFTQKIPCYLSFLISSFICSCIFLVPRKSTRNPVCIFLHREMLLVKMQPGDRKQIASANDVWWANTNRYGHILATHYFPVVRIFHFFNRCFILDMQNCRHEAQDNICSRLISYQMACKFFVSASLLYCHCTCLPLFQSKSILNSCVSV